jgi:hypothetical protein
MARIAPGLVAPMTRTEVISTIALLVSIASVGFSVFFNLRDRARLKTMSWFEQAVGRDFFGCVSRTVINAGRPPNHSSHVGRYRGQG